MGIEIANTLAQELRDMVPALRVEVEKVPSTRRYVILASVRHGVKWHTITLASSSEVALVLASLEVQADKANSRALIVA